MTITAADIKIGMCIEMDGKTFLVVDFQHCKPGKGPAFVRSKLKNLENGRVLENTFSSVSQKIEQVRVERRPYQFTYEDDLGAHFMHTETFGADLRSLCSSDNRFSRSTCFDCMDDI